MIGLYGGFDEAKYRRDFRESFYGIEACLFKSDEDTETLVREARSREFQIGIHFPLRAGRSHLRDALFLSPDRFEREQAFRLIADELDYMREAEVRPDYVLFHYPKPVVLDDHVDYRHWRFDDPRESIMESDYSFEEFKTRSEALFQWLSERAELDGFTPVLEFDGLNRYVCESDFLESLLNKHPKIRLCLDTGRLYLQERSDPRFDARRILRTYSKYAKQLHLWNLRFTDKVEAHHYPVLPEQKTEDGWAPIEEYLRIIKEESPEIRILFEHRSDLISDEELDRCYAWVSEIFGS